MIGQTSLRTFYDSVAFSYPTMADIMTEDIQEVSIFGLLADPSDAQPAADRLRQMSRDLPEILKRTLDSALTELGYN